MISRLIVIFSLVTLFTGCSFVSGQKSLYEVRLTSGERLYAESKPVLREGFYEFFDVNNQQYMINRTLVLYVEPAKYGR